MWTSGGDGVGPTFVPVLVSVAVRSLEFPDLRAATTAPSLARLPPPGFAYHVRVMGGCAVVRVHGVVSGWGESVHVGVHRGG